MKTLKKILTGLLILLAVVALAGYFFVRYISRKALPDYSQPLQLTGLIDEVNVYRDAHAVPHVYASNENDLYTTVGYLMAQDRLWQMDLLRRVTMGRLSEIFGKDMVDADHLLRSLRIPEKSLMVLDQSDENMHLALNAFASGVNQFIERHQKKMPPEFTILGYKPEPWEPLHSVNLIGYMAWDLTGSWGTEVVMHKLRQQLDEEKFIQLIPNLDKQKTYVYPSLLTEKPDDFFSLLGAASKLSNLGFEVFSASNNWAVSGAKSETGKPLLSNDMHLGFGAPGIWYQMHQVIEGKLNVTGVVLPGQPSVIVGHNKKIAWGMTNLYVDDIDFYLETLDAEEGNTYLFNGEWKNLEIRKEKIAVKGGDTLVREIQFTHRGPIISGFKKVKDQAISMRWTGNEFSNEMRSIYLLNRAGNWEEFQHALTTFISVSQNVIYADVEGNIGLQTSGGVPLRKDGNGLLIMPGDTDQYDWTGMLPFDKLPFSYNPPEGHLSSANNRTTSDDYPYTIGHWFDFSSRIDRIREMLTEKEKLNIDDFKRMLADVESKHVEDHLAGLVEIIRPVSSLSANELAALQYLESWDMQMTADSKAAAIFEKLYLNLARNLMQDEMGEELYTEFIGTRSNVRNLVNHVWKNQNSSWVDNVTTDEREEFNGLVLLSFRQAIQWLEETLGNDPNNWEWGKIHQLTIKHPLGSVKILDRVFSLNKGPFPIGGSYHTVNPLAYSFRDPFASVHGASQRHVYDLGNWANSYVVIPTGASGIPASKYYLNQTEMFVNNQYTKDLWLKEDVVAGARYHTVVSPQ
ncbi:MAG: penicillin acylase family protein [Bacteroidales bacterium]|nr:penicillin acylase family protein [Bacteroidales bacterium]MDZ4203839.1 penicillin acylase family protein [Bacteroidales bacterium]